MNEMATEKIQIGKNSMFGGFIDRAQKVTKKMQDAEHQLKSRHTLSSKG